MVGIGKDDSTRLIESEEKRLEESKKFEQVRTNDWCTYVCRGLDLSMDTVLNAMRNSGSATEFAHLLPLGGRHGDAKWEVLRSLRTSEVARRDFNEARNILEMPPIRDWSDLHVEVGLSSNNDSVVVDQAHPSRKTSATKKIKKKEV